MKSSIRYRPLRKATACGLSVLLGMGLILAVPPIQGQEASEPTETLSTAGKKKFRKRQPRPIRMGTSGGNLKDVTSEVCCDGTLGALVEKSGTQYILSNNHVIARNNKGKVGEAIIQPGLGDQPLSCLPQSPDADTVGFLRSRKRVKFGLGKSNKADVAIAEAVPGAVRSTGEIIGIGVPGTEPIEARVGMKVKKSGRTTGLTRGIVSEIHAMALVEFPNKCGSDIIREAVFTDLIFITGVNGNAFIRGGDSGSMVYQNKNKCPRPVGLIFAGGEALAAATPAATVQRIVTKLAPKGQMRFVGCESNAMQTSSSSSAQTAAASSTTLAGTSGISRPVLDEREIDLAVGAMRRWEETLWSAQGVHGFGIGVTLDGPVEPAIHVFTDQSPESVIDQLPERIDGYRVEVFEAPRLVAR